ncbi:MAG TPA: hypothetical protein VIO94_03935 [Phenylobacterium sp.]
MRFRLAVVCLLGSSMAGQALAAPPPSGASLSAAEVKAQVVGHSVALADGGMTWYFNANGQYDADDGRNGRSGRFVVQADGRLCWTESTGVAGCFQYYRKSGKLMVRRADPGHSTELGAVTLGAL